MDYSKISVNPHVGKEIGFLYMEAPSTITQTARDAYTSLALQTLRQYRELTKSIQVEFVAEDPYASASQMFADVRDNRRLKVWSTTDDQRHPLLTPFYNDRFRAVHDYYGHYETGRGFDRHGEEAAWMRHSRMFTGLGRRAMTTETRGQSSAFIWVMGGKHFPPQKAILLPEWVSELPE